MIQINYPTEQGLITYWINASKIPTKPWLVFLPGLTANHHLFKDQLEHFKEKANLLVWIHHHTETPDRLMPPGPLGNLQNGSTASWNRRASTIQYS